LARTIYQYQPINETPDQAIGISLPFNKAAAKRDVSDNYADNARSAGSAFSLTYTTEEQAISNLKNLLLTRKGERMMQPNFGTNIYDSLFEPNTEFLIDDLKNSLTEDIELWLPYIVLNRIDAIRNEHDINLRIVFQVSETGANLVINVLADENNLVTSEATAGAL